MALEKPNTVIAVLNLLTIGHIMIGFDLDGIFVPDMIKDEDNIENMLFARSNFFVPLFVPDHESICLITGRPYKDFNMTVQYLRRSGIKYKYLHHNNTDDLSHDNVVKFKAKVLNRSLTNPYIESINVFIESDERQVSELRKLCQKTTIIHFGEMINRTIATINKDCI